MSHKFGNFLKGYLTLSGVYGFHRGWIADYEYHSYQSRIYPIHYNLLTTQYSIKFFRGLMNGIMYSSFGHGDAIYRLFGRIEIQVLGKDPYQHKEMYTEWLSVTTLPFVDKKNE